MPSGHFCRNSLDRCTVSRKGVWFVSTVWGIHVTKWLGTLSLLLFLAPHNIGFFRISLFIPNGICSNIAQSTQKIKFFLVVSAILRSGLILENIRRMFLLSIWAAGTMYMNFDENILRMLSRIRPDCSIALTPPERAWFSSYSALYLNKFHQV